MQTTASPTAASENSTRTVRFKIKRQDAPDQPSYWQEFDIPYRPNLNVISCLQWIAANPRTVEGREVAPVAWDSCCLEEVCGACTMVMNGRVGQSCSKLLDELLEEGDTVTLEPMSKFPVVRDLWVNRQRMFNVLKEIRGWVPIDGTHHLGAGPTESPSNQELRYALSRCMTCGCCLEACPQFTMDNDFTGAFAFGQTLYFNMHKTGAELADERLTHMEEPGGISDCGQAQNCVKVCPKGVPLLDAIAAIGRQTTIHAIKKFFTGRF